MSLYDMLTTKRTAILEKCRVTMVATMGLSPFDHLDNGLSTLYDQLVEFVRFTPADQSSEARREFASNAVISSTSKKHAQHAYERGYTISQLVRGYGCLCQGITEFAHETAEPIASFEFAQLNLCLDVAIEQAVTEFQNLTLGCIEKDQKLKMGFLVHELRNCLAGAVLSHELIRMGLVGSDGSTSALLTNALTRMRDLIDRSVAEVRMEGDHDLVPTIFKLSNLISDVESSLTGESNAKLLTIHTHVDPAIELEADWLLMVSAITNIVQNAIKFSKFGGRIWIRGFVEESEAVIEIEDRCGGLPEGKIDEIFKPFAQVGRDRSGLGLGLAIVRQAAEITGCTLAVRNLENIGCVFSLRKPVYVRELQAQVGVGPLATG